MAELAFYYAVSRYYSPFLLLAQRTNWIPILSHKTHIFIYFTIIVSELIFFFLAGNIPEMMPF